MKGSPLIYPLACLSIGLLFWQCSPEATGPVARFYHNLNAHYNGYFLAKQSLDSVEYAIFRERQDHYLRLLPIYPEIDTNRLKRYETTLKDCIKKAAFAIERHPNSEWTDWAYLVVGKARFYLRDYNNAISTFKYLNAQSKNALVQDLALTELLRTYATIGEMQNAETVKNYLRQQGVEAGALKDFYLAQAFYYQKNKDTLRTLKSLELALPLLKSNSYRARLHYLQGQLYQQLNDPTQALHAFKEVQKHRPDYLLSLMARLQVLLLTDFRKVPYAKAEKQFERLLKDEKNLEYRGNIYYARAQYWLYRKRPESAKEDFSRATNLSQDPLYKAYGYLFLARLHYENLKQYRAAKAYYDSTLQFLPKEEPLYNNIQRRSKVLNQFVEYIETIELEDSLRTWAQKEKSMSPEAFDQELTQVLTRHVRKQIEEEEARKKAQQQQSLQQGSTLQEALNQQSNRTWYFDDPLAVAKGKSAFRQKWGNRALSDYWRVASKAASYPADESLQASSTTNGTTDPVALQVNALKEEFLKKLPRTKEALAVSHQRTQNALFNLGKIYQFQLLETDAADRSYQDLLNRYPQNPFLEEVLYLRYLIYKDKNPALAQEQKQALKQKYPTSIYLKLIEHPDYYQKMQAKTAEVEALYHEAFLQYEQKQYANALEKLEQLQQQYPDSHLREKTDFLVILCKRALNQNEWQTLAERFLLAHPKSAFTKLVEQMLTQIGSLPANTTP
ncbi:tetratricopeptide (TPR) repeat protein [Thermonema lapsum]|uniref:Tetratricopeptide (TPR) repeat protein n=1 Tax=Thermonema lapsum TaxID=28195 RepID=A0A846MQ45_9BACT|nr:tetratricopeptide repeat protein [Thermonema lapsum]NIK73480.1 tetratricopeptide (TPR) repeat protein [Thermonema lapsum]